MVLYLDYDFGAVQKTICSYRY